MEYFDERTREFVQAIAAHRTRGGEPPDAVEKAVGTAIRITWFRDHVDERIWWRMAAYHRRWALLVSWLRCNLPEELDALITVVALAEPRDLSEGPGEALRCVDDLWRQIRAQAPQELR